MATADVHVLAIAPSLTTAENRLRHVIAQLPKNQGFNIVRTGRRLTITVMAHSEGLALDSAERMAAKLAAMSGLTVSVGDPSQAPSRPVAQPATAQEPIENTASPSRPPALRTGPAVIAMLRHMRQHPERPFTLLALADALGVSSDATRNTMIKLQGWGLTALDGYQSSAKCSVKAALYALTPLGREPGSEDRAASAAHNSR